MSKVLILGGYGNFGKYIARTLLRDNIPVVLAGRKLDQLENITNNLRKQYKDASIQSIRLDVNQSDQTKRNLTHISPKVVINTCGPFQTANYHIVESCIQTRTHYIDLADGRNFVNGMSKFNQKALKNNTTVITGASSVPGLSSAVLEEFKDEFSRIDEMKYGITPGQNTNRGGDATIKGVMGYIGKPIAPFGALTKPIYGWQDIYLENYPQLGTRLFGNCEVPDLDIFPAKYGIHNMRFSAGTQNKLLHTCIWLTSWLIRLGLPLNLPKYSSQLLKISHAFDRFGTDEGGMHVKLTGLNKQNKSFILKWFIIVKKGHGPNVPIIPAILLAKKIIIQNWNLPGVHTCTGLVSLKQYLDGLNNFSFTTYIQRQFPSK